MLSRTDREITTFLQTECFSEIDFGSDQLPRSKSVDPSDSNEETKGIETNADESDHSIFEVIADDHRVYMEEIPRIREVYIRCNERLDGIHKVALNVFKSMTEITVEIQTMNEELYGLHDIETTEKPQKMKVMESRFDINEFMEYWKSMEQNQMYCFFKFWTLGMRYELQDCEAVLDIFGRYDAVFGKYKKVMTEGLKSLNSKSGMSGRERGRSYVNGLRDRFKNGIEHGLKYGGNGREQKVEEKEDTKGGVTVDVVHDTDDDEKLEVEPETENGHGNGKDEKEETVKNELSPEDKMKDIRTLLNTVCKVILKEQVPLLWEKRANTFNERVSQFVLKYTQCGIEQEKL